MSLYPRPLTDILNSVTALNGVSLIESQYSFSAPVEVDDDGSNTNTEITITALSAASAFSGSVTVRYKRLNLADLGTLVPLNIKGFNMSTTRRVATRLNNLYGLNFTDEDIVLEDTNLVDDTGSVTLTAAASSRGWIGSVTLNVSLGQRPLADYLTVTRLTGLPYPTTSVKKPYAAMYSYWRDFSAQHVALNDVVEGTSSLGVIQTALNAVTNDGWVTTGASRYSLDSAEVVYVGATADRPEDTNPEFEFVVIVQLNEDQSLSLSGLLYLHHNAPIF